MKVRSPKRPVVIYGAGQLGKMTRKFLDYIGIPFIYVVDIYAAKIKKSKEWQRVRILLPDEVPKEDRDEALLVLSVVTHPISPLKKKLTKNGWRSIVHAYDFLQQYEKFHPLNNGWSHTLAQRDKKNILKVRKLLKDKKSLEHYEQFVAWRTERKETLPIRSRISNDNRYFIPEVLSILGENEIFLDGGAHHGQTIERFLNFTKGKYKKIYAVEPDRVNLKSLRQNAKKIPRLTILPKALSDQQSKRKFYSGFDLASKLDNRGDFIVDTHSIDDLNLSPTFIKLHLEGEELKALKGGLKTIKNNRPIIAATIYHNSDGLWKTPLLLMESLNNYTYYMRLHSWAGTGMVLYAIPEERTKR